MCLGWAKLGCPQSVSAVCCYSKTARNGGTLTLKSSQPVVTIAMSNQTEDDEICGWTEIEPEFDHQRQAFQRGRDGLVVAIERDGRRSQNVVTLPENYHQDNQVIDYIEVGVEPEDAAETARAFMEQNNATTGAMSNQTEDDEIEQ